MKCFTRFIIALSLFSLASARAQEPVDHQVIARIKMEGFQRSQVMATLRSLTDVAGPRLTNSPGWKKAAEWSRDTMKGWGLANATLEPWGVFGRGWSLEQFSMEMTAPQYIPLRAFPKAWTPGSDSLVTGSPVFVEIASASDFDKYRGKLAGRIVMNRRPDPPGPHFEPDARRNTGEQLVQQEETMAPGSSGTYWSSKKSRAEGRERVEAIRNFFREEGIAGLIEPSGRDHGVLRVHSEGAYESGAKDTYPAFVLSKEHYGRILRLMDQNIPVTMRFGLSTRFHTEDSTGYNVIAEIPGTDPKLKDEVVILGAHLDSWHSGTGATDNAAGSAVMMEAMRILQTTGVKPRRTIRIALWSGEEQGLLGSQGYVNRHFADMETTKLKPEHEKLSAYFNLDNGTGKIRGIYLQGNEMVRPIFEDYLKPFHYLGATTVTINNTGGTDHLSFNWVGLPGFQFVQDPIEYGTRTHHTDVDVSDYVVEDDLKQAAVIIASFAYHTAMRNEKLPRLPLPVPPPDDKKPAQ
jgi:hypothetical protein